MDATLEIVFETQCRVASHLQVLFGLNRYDLGPVCAGGGRIPTLLWFCMGVSRPVLYDPV